MQSTRELKYPRVFFFFIILMIALIEGCTYAFCTGKIRTYCTITTCHFQVNTRWATRANGLATAPERRHHFDLISIVDARYLQVAMLQMHYARFYGELRITWDDSFTGAMRVSCIGYSEIDRTRGLFLEKVKRNNLAAWNSFLSSNHMEFND